MEEPKQIPHADSKKHPKTKTILLTLLPVVLIIFASGGVYYWQHKKLDQIQLQLNQSKQSNDSLKNNVGALNKQVSSLTAQLKGKSQVGSSTATETTPVASDNLTIKVLDAYRYYTTQYPNNPYIVVDVTLTNEDTSSLTLPASSFELRDLSDNGGAGFGELAGTTMPNGEKILGDQILASGQTVTGGLTFSAFNKNATLYTLTYRSQTFSIDASEQVNQQ
jgi:hypothetical protein